MGKFNPSVKKARIVPTARGYFHDLDPYKFFPTKADAIKDRARLLKLGVGLKSRSPRVPTFYTVLQGHHDEVRKRAAGPTHVPASRNP